MNRRELIAAITEALSEDDEAWSKNDVSDVISTFEQVVIDALVDGDTVNLSKFAKFSVKEKPARPARKGKNPFTGEMTTFKAKPASVAVKITPLKALKDDVAAQVAKKSASTKKSKKKNR